MSGVQAMVGTERFVLALQSEGRKSVEADWEVISKFPDFREGFKAIANIAAVAGWGRLGADFSRSGPEGVPVPREGQLGGTLPESAGGVLGERDAGGQDGGLLFEAF